MKTGSYSPVAPHSLSCVCCLAAVHVPREFFDDVGFINSQGGGDQLITGGMDDLALPLWHLFITATKQSLYTPPGYLPTHPLDKALTH